MSATSSNGQKPEFTVGRDRQHIADLQREFIRELLKRSRQIRGAIRERVGYEEDHFNLKQGQPTRTDTSHRQRFRKWLLATAAAAFGLDIADRDAERGGHWTARFLTAAAVQGFNQATGQLKQAGVSVDNPDDEIVRERVRATLTGERPLARLIADDHGGARSRYFSPLRQLDDVTDDMAQQLNQTLDEGFEKGWNPKKMATKLNAEIRQLERSRLATIARTETSFSHAEETLKRYKTMGVEGVGHVGRIVTPDESLCAWCRAIADTTFTLREFAGTRVLWRGQRWFVGVPAHPNGRCAPIPKPGIDADGLSPIEERLPAGAEVIGTGLMYRVGAVG